MSTAVYPGSFDPVTNGHLDIIRRGAALFDRVIVAVLHNPSKQGLFPVEKRLEMLRRVCAQLPNVQVDSFQGLLVDYVRQTGADVILRGLRSSKDLEAELPMAQLNRSMLPKAETLFLPASPQHLFTSSSAVREIGSFGGDVTPFVPACIRQEVEQAFQKRMKQED